MLRFRSLIIAVVVLMVSVLAFTVWAVSRIPATEAPPCRSCSSIYSGAEIPTANLCELVPHLEQFSGKIVRVSGILHHDAGTLSLRNQDCGGIYLGLSPSCESCAGTQKALTIYTGFRTWYDSDANATVVAKIGPIEGDNNFYRGYDGLTVVCLERVEAIGFGLGHRIYYTLGQIVKRILG